MEVSGQCCTLAALPSRREPHFALDRGWVGQSWSGHFVEGKNLLFLP